MRKLIKNELNNISGGTLSADCADAVDKFKEKCKDLGYQVSEGWNSFRDTVKEFGAENVPYYTVPSLTGEEDYIIFAISSKKLKPSNKPTANRIFRYKTLLKSF